ncbi:hypothetical protein SAMN05443287_106161 [Micromonospora phaseoli]|uniref:Uncharacterized protein n=1 Tax=Micromonospora phaseoli TaxID=1144548 RepID=A0A1H7ANE3_9ACTN|nr:hypothetical protein [Micromonospora phaseoli]PZV96349.1 hypothetical protein CLV64_107227 [Micromonospora phaseoli]GIJ76036.1 hypothetical protein Xph01_04680 [Micromonospora phaseoli]SEJ65387.1 hypothetical protein SAMN05443287_106161 [Micromonospora phaseoli]
MPSPYVAGTAACPVGIIGEYAVQASMIVDSTDPHPNRRYDDAGPDG